MKLTLAAIAAALALQAGTALAHAHLQASMPANGASVDVPPHELRLVYSEPVEATLSTVRLFGAGDVAVPTDKVLADKADAKTLVLGLPALAAGAYRADWSTMSHDGHRSQGAVRFIVK